MQNETSQFFTETQPLIYQRLLKITRIFWVMAVIIFTASLVRAYILYTTHGADDPRFIHQIINSLAFLPYILVMIYADRIAKENPRLATQITLLATFSELVIQVMLNGNQAMHIMMSMVLLMILAGFLTNTRATIITSAACMILVVIIAILESMGLESLNPESQGYFSVKSAVYAALILFGSYKVIETMVHDFLVIQDGLIKEKQRAEEIAIRDSLTNLYNRYYGEKAAREFFTSMEPDEKGFLLFIDIDNFKMINTRFGHEGGDDALKIVAKRLEIVAENKKAVACRIGGDEFILLLISTDTGAQEVSHEIMSALAEPFEIYKQEAQFTCSVGIAKTNRNSSFSELYRNANTAMHRAKHSGKNRLIEHHQAYSDEELSRANMLNNLELALDRDQFELNYQPQVDLETGKIIGMEALLRWQLNGKQVMPDDFLGLAEQYGLIHSITDWIIQQACKDCKYLHDNGFEKLTVAVNISADLLKQNNLAKTVEETLRATGLPSSALELELTESALFEPGNRSGGEQLANLREQGIELSIDDFGTGYSNLQYLGQLDVQKLKIDKSFVMPLEDHSPQAHDLISAIIDIAKRFHLKTVAEGIENNEVAAKLRKMKCDVAQGYYWSKPVSINVIYDLLKKDAVDCIA